MNDKWTKTPAGLLIPERVVDGKRIEAAPAGMGIWAKAGYDILDKNGKLLKSWEGPAHSFVRNFGLFVRGFLQNLESALNVNETLTDDAGASFLPRLKQGSGFSDNVVSGAAKMKFGNSNTALDSTQFDLQGALLGSEVSVTTTLIVEDSVQTQFKCEGQVTNNSGSSFTVHELGLYSELGAQGGGGNNTTLMLRELLSQPGGVAVADTLTILGRVTFTLAV